MDLSIYPKIPGKNWTITKAAFTSSITSAHGLDVPLNGLPDDASKAAVLNQKSNCKLMYSVLLATNSRDNAWIVKSHDRNDSDGVWKAICMKVWVMSTPAINK